MVAAGWHTSRPHIEKAGARMLAQKKGCDSEDAAALLKEYDAPVAG